MLPQRLATISATFCLLAISCLTGAFADEQAPTPLTQMITLPGTINGAAYGRVQNVASKLAHESEQEGRGAILFLQINPGSSRFHEVIGLADLLTSADFAKVKTVAWVPETVTGHNAILALVCREIVMHPDAELGDIGVAEALDEDDQQAVIRLIRKRTNIKVSEALALGMMDPGQVVKKLKVQQDGAAETRIVTQKQHDDLRDARVPILDVETIKEAGARGILSGRAARAVDVLVTQTAESLNDLANQYNVERSELREDPTSGTAPKAALILIDDMIEPILEAFVMRQTERAIAGGANLIIYKIDSPGGYVHSSENIARYIAGLEKQEVRTVAFVPKQALSGATMIALGCDEIYINPTATFGDVEPIEMQAGGQFERAPEKIMSVVREILSTLAEEKGRPGALAEAMADPDLLVYKVTHAKTGRIWYMTEDEIHEANEEWVKGPVVPETREKNLLTVNGTRAHELRLAEEPVENLDELKIRIGLPDDYELRPSARTWVDTTVYVLNQPIVTGLLFMLGMACIIIEVYTWTSFFGILSAVFFGLFFWSRVLGGTAGWLEVTFFVLGAACIAMEIFVIPGFGIFGVSGTLLVLIGIILASERFYIPTTRENFVSIGNTLTTLGGSALAALVLALTFSHFLPKIPGLRGMILHPPGEHPDDEELRLRPEYGLVPGEGINVGSRGTASSDLRPAGKAMIEDHLVDVVSDGPYIESGTAIEVMQMAGNRIVVRQVG